MDSEISTETNDTIMGIFDSSCVDYNGTILSKENTMERMETHGRMESYQDVSTQYTSITTINIYRFKMTPVIINDISTFSKRYQYVSQKEFKTAWDEWMKINKENIATEHMRLTQLGYIGDMEEKLYNSARYYYRNKGTTKKEPDTRRKYCSSDKELLKAMDTHIISTRLKPEYSPASGFDNFVRENNLLLKNSLSQLLEKQLTSKDIYLKIKKTYKNRYFRIISK